MHVQECVFLCLVPTQNLCSTHTCDVGAVLQFRADISSILDILVSKALPQAGIIMTCRVSIADLTSNQHWALKCLPHKLQQRPSQSCLISCQPHTERLAQAFCHFIQGPQIWYGPQPQGRPGLDPSCPLQEPQAKPKPRESWHQCLALSRKLWASRAGRRVCKGELQLCTTQSLHTQSNNRKGEHCTPVQSALPALALCSLPLQTNKCLSVATYACVSAAEHLIVSCSSRLAEQHGHSPTAACCFALLTWLRQLPRVSMP